MVLGGTSIVGNSCFAGDAGKDVGTDFERYFHHAYGYVKKNITSSKEKVVHTIKDNKHVSQFLGCHMGASIGASVSASVGAFLFRRALGFKIPIWKQLMGFVGSVIFASFGMTLGAKATEYVFSEILEEDQRGMCNQLNEPVMSVLLRAIGRDFLGKR